MKPGILFIGSLIGFTTLFSACKETSVPPDVLYSTDFRQDRNGWTASYTDYSTQVTDLDFKTAWTALPQPLDTTQKSIMVSSMNRSDDTFMFLKKKLTNLRPNTAYLY